MLVIEYGDVEFAPAIFDPPSVWLEPPADAPPAWSFNSLPIPDMANRSAFVQVGQAVGGSSTINGMFFERGSRYDYDAWTAVGGQEFSLSPIKWNWAGIFPFFKKVTTYAPTTGWNLRLMYAGARRA